ncbi:unnamed protein product [Ixodes hexagonus]
MFCRGHGCAPLGSLCVSEASPGDMARRFLLAFVCWLALLGASAVQSDVQADRDQGEELLLPVLGSLPEMLGSAGRLARADEAYKAGQPEPLLPLQQQLYRAPLRRHSYQTLIRTPRQYVDLEPGFVMSGSPFANQFQGKWPRSAPAQIPPSKHGVLPGAIIIDVRHGILLPEGRTREELEPVIRDSYRILDHYLHSNDTHESRTKIIKTRRRRSAPQGRRRRTSSALVGFAAKQNGKTLNVAAGPLAPAPRSAAEVAIPQVEGHSPFWETETVFLKKARSTTQTETTTTMGTTGSEIQSTSEPAKKETTVAERALTMHPELRRFLVEGNVNGTQSDIFVLKDKLDPEQVRPFRLLKVNSTNVTDAYLGTGLETIGRYWLLSPWSRPGGRKGRRRRSVPPYYAVNSFAMNPAYTAGKNKTYYTVFAKVSEAVLQDFIAQNANQRKVHESADVTNMYSGGLFNYVVDNAGKEGKPQPVREHKDGETMEDAFHQVYKDMKKNDELKFGTMAPAGLADEKVEAAVLADVPAGSAEAKVVDNTHQAAQRAGLNKRSHNYRQPDFSGAIAEVSGNEDDHDHGHEHDQDHDHEAPAHPEVSQTDEEHHDLHEAVNAAAPLISADVYQGQIEAKHTLRDKTSLEQAPRGFSPEFVANLKRLAELGYIQNPDLSGRGSFVDQEAKNPETSRDAAVMTLNDLPYASMQSRDELSPPRREYRTPKANPFDHFGMAYHPLKGRKLDASFFESLLPEAVIVPDPDKDMDSASDYPVAVLYRVPRDRLQRSMVPRQGFSRELRDARFRDARYQGPALALQRRARWFSSRGKEDVTPSTTKDNIKCIYRKNSVVCYQSR